MNLLKSLVVVVFMAVSLPAMAEPARLRVALPANFTTLDPQKGKIGEEFVFAHLVYSGLTDIDPQMQVRPDLAERWTASEDLKTWTFFLREGVKFHDGKPLTSDDVVFSIKRILDPATGSVARSNLSLIEKVEAVEPLVVRFTLSIPYAPFPEILADRTTKIIPRDKAATIGTEPIGTGPFRFKDYKPGDRIELTKNDTYYRKNAPQLDAVTLRIIPESAAQGAALRSGEIDLAWNVALETVDMFSTDSKFIVDKTPTTSWDGLIMHNGKPPFNDVRVRKAVEAMIDKKQLVDLALFGNGEPAHAMIPPSSPAFASELPITKPDVAKAKALLAEAGMPDGFEIPLYVPGERPNRERAAVAIREMLRPAGIRVNLQRVTFQKFLSDIEGKAEFYVDGFLGRPNADSALYPFFHSTGSWNIQLWHYNSAEMDSVLASSRAAKTIDAQYDAYKTAQKIIVNDAPGVVFYVINHVNIHSENVKGFKSSPLLVLDLRDVSIK